MVTPAAHREAARICAQPMRRASGGRAVSLAVTGPACAIGPSARTMLPCANGSEPWHERRFGYRRLHVLLRREGYGVNRKRIYRLYREERLMVRKRSGRKRALGTRAPMVLPMAADMRWSLDFVSDQMTSGRRFGILCVVDDCTRECLALIADTSLSGLRGA